MFEEDDGSNDSGDIEALRSLLDWEEHEEKALTSTVEATTRALAQREHQNHPPIEQLGLNENKCNSSFEQYSSNLIEIQRQMTDELCNDPQAQARDNATASVLPGSAQSSTASSEVSSTPRKSTCSKKQEAQTESDKKMKIVRDRNREHARNTRLRKKQYLEELKNSVTALGKERDSLVNERKTAAKMVAEMTRTRTQTLMNFFALRTSNERNRALWTRVLEESGFQCTFPLTPYRSFPSSEVQLSKCQRTIIGIDGMMADTASLHVMMNNLVNREIFPKGVVKFTYTVVMEDGVFSGNKLMSRWLLQTLNATQCGARREISNSGMLSCRFNSEHRIVALDLMFDVMSFLLQLKQSFVSGDFYMIPNTVQTSLKTNFQQPMVITTANSPYTIVKVNQMWQEMTGYTAHDVCGRCSCQILEGRDTDKSELEKLMECVRFKISGMTDIINYTKSAIRFRNFMSIYPLSTDSMITHYLGLTTFYRNIDVFPNEQLSAFHSISRPLGSCSGTFSSHNLER